MKFDPTINLGSAIETISFLFAIGAVLVKFGRLEAKVELMYAWFQEVGMTGRPHKRRAGGD